MPRNRPVDYFNALPADDRRRTAPAVARNRDPILEILRARLELPCRVLEVASGTGEHGAYFCSSMRGLEWQPSDVDPVNLSSIQAWRESTEPSQLLAPVRFDLLAALDPLPFPAESFDAGFCANLIHIAPWQVCERLMVVMQRLLKPAAPLILYGPYRINGVHTAPSNEQFEHWLQGLDPAYGVRDLESVRAEGALNGLQLEETIPMPSNNFCLVFRKRPASQVLDD